MKSQHRNYSGKMVSHICQGYGKVFIFMHLELLESFRLTSKVSGESWHESMKNLIIAQEYSRTVDIDPIKDEKNRLERRREMAVGLRHVHGISTPLIQIPVKYDGNGALQQPFLFAAVADCAHLGWGQYLRFESILAQLSDFSLITATLRECSWKLHRSLL
jgi:hypothetical protein